jgi:phospholipase/carboxylesterase
MSGRFSFQPIDQVQHSAGKGEMARGAVAAAPLASLGLALLTRDASCGPAHADAASLGVDDLYVPEHYEANYAYPLLAWLAPPDGTLLRLQRLMPLISDRNYFGVTVPAGGPEKMDELLFATFLRLRRKYHLHTERVYLAGFGDAGTQALETALRRPEWFAGVAAISARCPESPRLLARFNGLRGKRVLLGVDEQGHAPILADCLYMQQLFWSAGMQVTAVASSPGRDCRRGLLREIDRWIMHGIEQPELVC